MTVYVDDMYRYPMGEFRRGKRLMKMSHLIADTEAELHAMAVKIGVARRWYQGDHYDVALQARKLAVSLGAVEITLAQCSAMSMLRGRDPNKPLAKPEEAEALRKAQREETANALPNL
jgi:hypothetical protein